MSVLTLTILSSTAHADPWRDKMQALSKTLVDAFPFLYSSTEFKDKKNEKRILKSLESLGAQVHGLPSKDGQSWIGNDPMIENAQTELQTGFKNAAELFKKAQHEPAQKLVHASINRCLACHTAHQVGPQVPAANSEVMAMATPYALGKAVVFGALRQFDGALDWIENQGFSQINKARPGEDDLLKLHLVIALRAKLDFTRAENFLNRILKDSKNSEDLKKWVADIQAWKAGQPSRGGEGPGAFVSQLRESINLHRLFAKATPSGRKEASAKLSALYKAMNFSPFADLSELYAARAK